MSFKILTLTNGTLNIHPNFTYCSKFWFFFFFSSILNNYKRLIYRSLNQIFFSCHFSRTTKPIEHHLQPPVIVANNHITISQNHDIRFLTRNKLYDIFIRSNTNRIKLHKIIIILMNTQNIK